MYVWAEEARAARQGEKEEWRCSAWRKCEMYIWWMSLESGSEAREPSEPDQEEWEEWERQKRERKKQDDEWRRAWQEDWLHIELERHARSLKRARPGFDDFE